VVATSAVALATMTAAQAENRNGNDYWADSDRDQQDSSRRQGRHDATHPRQRMRKTSQRQGDGWEDRNWQRDQRSKYRSGRQGSFSPNLINANSLIGAEVTNRRGQDLGTIEEVVLNRQRDGVSYVALSTGGTWGIGSSYVAVPWQALTVRSKNRDQVQKVLLNASPEQLDKARTFDSDYWPDRASGRRSDRDRSDRSRSNRGRSARRGDRGDLDRNWVEGQWMRGVPSRNRTSRLHSNRRSQRNRDQRNDSAMSDRRSRRSYNQRNRDDQDASNRSNRRRWYRESDSQQMEFRRLTRIVGMEVKSRNDDDFGNIEQVILDLREGRPVYAVIGFGGLMGMGQDLAALPWSLVNIHPQKEIAQIDTRAQTLRSIAYSEGNAPDLEKMDRAEKLHQRFDEEPYWQTFGYAGPSDEAGQPSRDRDQQMDEQARQQQKEYEESFDPDRMVTRRGKIVGVGTHRIGPGAGKRERLRVKSDTGKVFVVHAGDPDDEQQSGRFRYGQDVEVTGSETKVKGRPVLIAVRIIPIQPAIEYRSSQDRDEQRKQDREQDDQEN
jgi:sporulation protein YlmC with PRC-barrel domain